MGLPRGSFLQRISVHCWVSAVPLYRFYKLDKTGHIAGLPEAVDCTDDTDAAEKARQRAANEVIEIWDLARRVAVVGTRDKKPGQKGNAR